MSRGLGDVYKRQALKGTNIDEIKAKHKELEETFQKIATNVYQQAAQAQQAAGGQGFDPNNMGGGAAQNGGANNGDDVIDAEFTDAE